MAFAAVAGFSRGSHSTGKARDSYVRILDTDEPKMHDVETIKHSIPYDLYESMIEHTEEFKKWPVFKGVSFHCRWVVNGNIEINSVEDLKKHMELFTDSKTWGVNMVLRFGVDQNSNAINIFTDETYKLQVGVSEFGEGKYCHEWDCLWRQRRRETNLRLFYAQKIVHMIAGYCVPEETRHHVVCSEEWMDYEGKEITFVVEPQHITITYEGVLFGKKTSPFTSIGAFTEQIKKYWLPSKWLMTRLEVLEGYVRHLENHYIA